MQRDLGLYLWDVSQAIQHIQDFIADFSYEQFLASSKTQAAVERKLEIIGEAIKQADRHFPGVLDSLPSRSLIVGFRNRLAHACFSLNHEIVWVAIEKDLPERKQAVDLLLSMVPPDSP